MASPQAEALKTRLRRIAEKPGARVPNVDRLRRTTAAMIEMATEPAAVSTKSVDTNGVPALWIAPDGASPSEVILYAHGGAYVSGSVDSHRRLVGHIAVAAGRRALSIDYRLAPEHPYPAQVEDLLTAYEWLLNSGVAPANVIMGGDSAGGGLVATAILKLRDDGRPVPAGCVLICPVLDLTGSGESMRTRADDDMVITEDLFKWFAALYVQKTHGMQDPYVSPLLADLNGFPPTYLVVGDHEVLRDDSTRFAAKAVAGGVDATVDVFPEMPHCFVACAGNVPEADDAVNRIANWMRASVPTNRLRRLNAYYTEAQQQACFELA